MADPYVNCAKDEDYKQVSQADIILYNTVGIVSGSAVQGLEWMGVGISEA